MRGLRKTLTSVLLILVIGMPVYAGGMDTPKPQVANPISLMPADVGGASALSQNGGLETRSPIDPLIAPWIPLIQSVMALV